MSSRWLAFTLLMVSALPAICVDRIHYDELNRKALIAAQAHDWKTLRAALLGLGAEMPVPTPYYMLRMASVETRLGNNDAAIGWLSRYASAGLTYDASSDDDLRPLVMQPGYKAVAAEMQRRTQAISNTQLVCTLPLLDLMPEDITIGETPGSFVTSSIQHHRLYRISLPSTSGECGIEEMPLEDDAKRWPTMAVSADRVHGLLWMTAVAMPGFPGVTEADKGKSALIAVDSATGKIIRRFDVDASKNAVLGDMCIGKDGTVYVSDSAGGAVYRVHGDPNTAVMEKIADGLFSPQTPVLAADGKRLFVADYSMGIAVIHINKKVARKVDYLPHPEKIAITGLDGLYRTGNSLIGMQNGTEPERIMRFHLNRRQTEIVSSEVIEQASRRLGDPTHAVLVDGVYYVSANVGWDKVGDSGQLKTGEHFSAPVLLSFPAAK